MRHLLLLHVGSALISTSLLLAMSGTAHGTTTTTNVTTTTTSSGLTKSFEEVIVVTAVDNRPVIKVGSPNSLAPTSNFYTYGRLFMRAWLMFFEWLNHKRGGVLVNGVWHKVEFTMVNDNSDKATVREATKWLMHKKGIKLFFSTYASSRSEEVAKVVQAGGGVALCPGAALTSVYRGRDRIFGIPPAMPNYLESAFVAVGTMVRSVAAFYQDTTVMSNRTGGACSVVQNHSRTYGIQFNPDTDFYKIPRYPSAGDVTQLVKFMKKAGKDMIIGCVYASECTSFINEAKVQQLNAEAIMLLQCLTLPTILQDTGLGQGRAAARYIGGVAPWMPSMNLVSELSPDWTASSFSAEYERRFGELPAYQATMAFSAAEVLVLAIERTNSVDPGTLATYMQSAIFETALGKISFDVYRQNAMSFKIVQFFTGETVPKVVSPVGLQQRRVMFPIPPWSDRKCFDMNPAESVFGYVVNHQAPTPYGACQECPTQYQASFNTTTQVRECRACGAGQHAYNSGSGTDEDGNAVTLRKCVQMCSPGYVAPDATGCKPCLPGQFQVGASCQLCEAGRYTNQVAQSNCKACHLGTYANASGQTGCTQCEPGTAISQPGQGSCNPCPAGKFISTYGESECLLCQAGTVAVLVGAQSCASCNAGRFSVWGAVRCDPCAIGTYQPDPGKDLCKRVVQGAAAPRTGMLEAENDAMYWASRDWSVVNLTSISWELCKFTPDACLPKEKCTEGNVGRQCQTCSPGYSRSDPGGVCWKCWSRGYYATVTFVVTMLLTFLCICLAYLTKKAADRPQDVHSIILKLLLNHFITMNVVSLILQEIIASAKGLSNTSVTWSNRLRIMFDFGELPSTYQVFSIECLVSSVVSADKQAQLDILQAANHSWSMSPALAKERETLSDILNIDETFFVAFWFCWPFLLMFTSMFVGWFWLHRKLSHNSDKFAQALEFYQKVYEKDFMAAKKKLLKDNWTAFVDLYFKHQKSLWWPTRHARVFLKTRPRRVDFKHFWNECQPVRAAVCFITYGSTLRGAARALKCVELAPGESQVLLSRSQLECKRENSVMWMALFSVMIWGVGYPLATFLRLHASRGELATNKQLMYQWALMINGYSKWWWEVVVFLRKAAGYALYATPFDKWGEDGRVLCFLIMALFFSCLHVLVCPFEKRANGLLQKIEGNQLTIWVVCCILLKYLAAEPSEKSAILIPLFIVLMHWIYLVWLIYQLYVSVCTSVAANWHWQKLQEMPPGWQKNFKIHVFKVPMKRQQKQPVVTVDHLYSWMTSLAGNPAGPPPSVPKGKLADVFENNRPPLSMGLAAVQACARGTVDESLIAGENSIEVAGGRARLRIQDAIHTAVQHIILTNEKSVFSVSLLDFVLRAAFTLNFEEPEGGHAKMNDAPQEVSEFVWNEAAKVRDPLKLLDDKFGKEDAPQEKDGAADDGQIIQKGLLMEEHLSSDGLEVVLTTQQRRREIKKAEAAANEEKNLGSDSDQTRGMTKERMLQDERLRKKVDLMYSAAPYHRTLTLEDMQLKLLQLQRLPSDELSHWMDIFEEQWIIEKQKNAVDLRRVAGYFKDEDASVEMAKPKDDDHAQDNDELRFLAQIEQTPEEIDAGSLTPEMRWIRLCMRQGRRSIKLPMLYQATHSYFKKCEKKLNAQLEETREERRKLEQMFREKGLDPSLRDRLAIAPAPNSEATPAENEGAFLKAESTGEGMSIAAEEVATPAAANETVAAEEAATSAAAKATVPVLDLPTNVRSPAPKKRAGSKDTAE